jgi:hypothetical protein
MENVRFFTPYFVSIVVIAGWLISYYILMKQELVKSKLDVRIGALINAYKTIERSITYSEIPNDNEISSAVSDIYLYGSSRQIVKLNQFVEALKCDCQISIKALLMQLRREIRQELGISSTNEGNEVDLAAYTKVLPNKEKLTQCDIDLIFCMKTAPF